MIDIGNNVWINADDIESVRLLEDSFGLGNERLVVGLRSGKEFYLPTNWTVYDLFGRMYPD